MTVFNIWLLSVIEGSCLCHKEKHDQCVEFEVLTEVTSGMWCHVIRLSHTDILKELAASIISVGSRFVWNVCMCLPDHMVSHPRRHFSSESVCINATGYSASDHTLHYYSGNLSGWTLQSCNTTMIVPDLKYDHQPVLLAFLKSHVLW